MKAKSNKTRDYTFNLLKYLKEFKGQLITVVGLLILAIAAGLGVPYLNSIIVNNVIANSDYKLLILVVLAVLALMIIESTVVFFQSRVIARIGHNVSATIRQDLYESIEKSDVDFFSTHTSGDMLQRVTNYVDEFANFLSNFVVILATNGFKLVLVIVFMLALSPLLTLVIFGSLIINFCFLFLLKNVIAKKSGKIKIQEALRINAVMNTIKGRKLIKAYNQQEDAINSYEKAIDSYTHEWSRYVRVNELFVPGVEILWYLGAVLLYFVSFYLLNSETIALTIGAVIAVNGYVTQLTNPLIQLGVVLQQIGGLKGAADNVFSLIEKKPAIAEIDNPISLNEITKIKFDKVGLTIKRKKLVDDLTVTLYKGETVGFACTNEKARSQIALLMMRYVDATKGLIEINDINIKNLRITNLRNNCVSMDTVGLVFNTTALENIRYARELATDEQVIAAAKLSGAHKFISKLSQGYDTILDQSVPLSVGQRQAISFARVLLHNPQVYIFDDISNNLAQVVKENTIEIITTHLKDKTVVIISNDEQMLSLCDKVVFMDSNSTVIDTHDNLMSSNEYYAQHIES